MKLVLVIIICLMSNIGLASDRIALVLGNSDYQHVGSLANTINDAKAIANTLENRGFKVILGINTGNKATRKLMVEFEQLMNKAEVALFYYAGHGVQLKGINYIVPVDAEVQSVSLLPSETVPVDAVLDMMERSANETNIIILDACRNNPFPDTARSLSRGLARVQAPSGSIVAYATAPGKVASDGAFENSPYTKSLLEALNEPGLKIEEIFKRVRVRVKELTSGEQTPWEESSLVGDFYFTPEIDIDITVDNSSAGSSEELQEIAYWNGVNNTGDIAQLESYINQYPDGTFVSLARLKINQLQANAESEPATAYGQLQVSPLSVCVEHLSKNRLTSGEGGNAFDCYSDILRTNPGSIEAKKGIDAIEEKYLGWALNAVDKKQKKKVISYMNKIKLVNPSSQSISMLERKNQSIEESFSTTTIGSSTTHTLLQKRRKSSVNGYYKKQ